MSKKIAFITGTNRGLGYSMAKHLVEAGVDVIGTYHSNREQAHAAERTVRTGDARMRMLRLDIADSSSFQEFKTELAGVLRDEFNRDRIDYVVHNAGNIIHSRFPDTRAEQLDNQYNVHFKGPYLLSAALLPLIRDGGRILNVTTAATRFYLDDHGPYSALKAATEVITLYMAKELGERRITVNAVAPGAVATDFGGGMVRDDAKVRQMLAEATPLGRVGEADDIGAAVAGLLSDNMGWVNGQRIEVTGGQSL